MGRFQRSLGRVDCGGVFCTEYLGRMSDIEPEVYIMRAGSQTRRQLVAVEDISRILAAVRSNLYAQGHPPH